MAKSKAKQTTQRQEKKSYRKAVRAALQDIRPRGLRTRSYRTPQSLRKDSLPLHEDYDS